MYIEKGNELILKKKIIKEKPVKILGHLFESHERYRKETVYSDMQYLIEKLEYISGRKFEDKAVTVNDIPVADDMAREEYYPVTVSFTVNSDDVSVSDTEISFEGMRIPCIDRKGLLNIRGRKVVCINELNKAQDLTVDEKGNYQLITLDSSINFNKPKIKYTMNFKGVRGSCSIAELAVYIGCIKGELDPESDVTGEVFRYISENYSGISMRLMAETIKDTFVSTVYKKVSDVLLYTDLFSIRLGKARKYINEYFSADKVLGQTFSRALDGYEKNELITPEILGDLKKKKIKKIYIRYNPKLTGYFMGEDMGNILIPEGTKVSDFLLSRLPELKGYGYTPETMCADIGIKKGTLIDNDVNEFLHSLGLEKINILKTEKGKNVITILFEKEVLINYESHNSETITAEDIEALISYLSGTMDVPEIYTLYHRDTDFLKNVYSFAETFSSAFRRMVRQYISPINAIEVKTAFNRAAAGRPSEFKKFMRKLQNKTFDYLYEQSYHNEPDFKNPLALAHTSRKLVTMVSENGASIAMRAILMGHYGRLCPFDTPQSAKIGLTNNIAVRAKIKDGILTTPYHPIIKKSGKYYVSEKIRYLTPKDEFSFKIGDILMLENEDSNVSVFNSPIVNKAVQARVPSVSNTDSESVTVESIPSFELDFVNVYENQILSQSASLIPFVGANDGARITFACSMLRQAEAVFKSERPYVYTGMYEWLVNDMDYCIKAEYDGTVKKITTNSMTVCYENVGMITIPLQRSSFKTGNIIIMETKKGEGESFRKGEIIADSLISKDGMFTPGVNVLVAYLPYYGYNNEDGIVITEKAAEKFTSLNLNRLSLSLGNYSKNKWKYKSYIKNGEYVNSGKSILRVSSVLKKVKPKELKARFGKSGILQSISRNFEDNEDKITYTANIISFDELISGDKMAGRHGNKGVVTLVEKNSKASSFLNGEVVDVILNPCGVPSRMNLGQLLEAHLGFVCYLLDLHIRSDSFNGASEDEIKELLRFCYDIANADSAESVLNSKEYAHLPDIVKNRAKERYDYIRTWKGCFYPDGTAELINNRNGRKFAGRVVIGCAYFMKLAHEVEHKRTERSGVIEGTTYGAVSKQPMKGSKRLGGQTIGEMEMWAEIAHGASNLLLESLHDKSDNVYIRKAMQRALNDEIEYEKGIDSSMFSNHATEVFRYLIEGMNGCIDTNVGTDLSLEAIIKETHIDDTKEDEDNEVDEILKNEFYGISYNGE